MIQALKNLTAAIANNLIHEVGSSVRHRVPDLTPHMTHSVSDQCVRIVHVKKSLICDLNYSKNITVVNSLQPAVV